jgi:hypothetical protein
MKLKDLPSQVRPAGALIDLAWLRDGVGDEFEVVYRVGADDFPIDRQIVRAAVELFLEPALIKKPKGAARRQLIFNGVSPGDFRVDLVENKASYSVRARWLRDILIVHRDGRRESISQGRTRTRNRAVRRS